MSFFQPFAPHRGSSQTLSATTTSQIATIDGDDLSVRIVNTGSNLGYVVTYGTSETAIVATEAQHGVAAGATSVISKPKGHNRLAYISATSTTTLIVSTGEGL